MSEDKKLLLEVQDLKVHFDIRSGKSWPWTPPNKLKAVDGVTLRLYEGETLGVVGESGCGKSTFVRGIIGLVPTTAGKVVWLGQDLTELSEREMREKRQEIQMIFQDPLASLNPRMTIGDIIAEPLRTFYPKMPKQQVKDKVKAMMMKVGLLPNVINRYPHEFSGGQCQRIGIARALILEPKMVICDEPVSALDVSIQAQVVNLLKDLQKEMGLSLIFIAHDLSVVRHISDRVLVMYLGNEMELGEVNSLFENPLHPYTRALMSAVPIPDPKLERNKEIQLLEGDLPSPINPPRAVFFEPAAPSPGQSVPRPTPCWREASSTRFPASRSIRFKSQPVQVIRTRRIMDAPFLLLLLKVLLVALIARGKVFGCAAIGENLL
ncbi:murein tripeptide/oligopeptide ABC transporter ATP binding protein OppF [Dongshaea marina]